jgi:hypothetical protein
MQAWAMYADAGVGWFVGDEMIRDRFIRRLVPRR